MMSDRIADMLTRIRNAGLAGLEKVEMPSSKALEGIAAILRDEGYLVSAKGYNHKGFRHLRLVIRYGDDGKSAFHELKRVSRPGRRVYAGAGELPRVKSGYGIAVISTSKGLMTDRQARKESVGGEIICTVF